MHDGRFMDMSSLRKQNKRLKCNILRFSKNGVAVDDTLPPDATR